MAGNVKKGFGTYLFIFLMCVVAAFLITCVVMIFQPFKEILGYKYYTFSETSPFEYQLTDASNNIIDFENIDIVRISSDYANIRIEKNAHVDNAVAVVVKNNSKGFAKAEQDTDFSYSITQTSQDGKMVLDVSIKEPQSVLSFSKDIEISFYIPYYDVADGSHDVSDKKFILTTQSGNIFVGNARAVNQVNIDKDVSNENINPKDLTIQSGSGRIYIYSHLDTSALQNLSIKTNSASVNMYSDEINVARSFSFSTQNGGLYANNISGRGENKINLRNGKFSVDTFKGKVDLGIRGGNISISKLDGSIVSESTIESATNGKILISQVLGNVSLPFLGNSQVEFGHITGQAYLEGEGADISIKKIDGRSWIKTTSGKVYVYSNNQSLSVHTEKGYINAYFNSSSLENVIFRSTSGQINLHVLKSLAYKMNVYNLDGELRENGIKVEPFDEYKNPCIVNQGIKEIKFISNGNINVTTFQPAS